MHFNDENFEIKTGGLVNIWVEEVKSKINRDWVRGGGGSRSLEDIFPLISQIKI